MSETIETSWQELLQTEGILCRGYGILPKYAMLDKDLTLQAKAIYAYFCSMCGSGTTAFPGRDKIKDDLGMGNEVYYKHRKLLEEQGYLSVQQYRRIGRKLTSNLYILNANPKKFSEEDTGSQWKSAVFSTIRLNGLKAAGYGAIPKAVMQDERLSLKDKGVYAYFASYAGSGNSAFPEVAKILMDLQISKPTYLKSMKVLKELDYIRVEQRNVNGSFAVNDYYLNEFPSESEKGRGEPWSKNPNTQNPHTELPHTQKPSTAKPKAQKPDAENPSTINNTPVTKNKTLDYKHPSHQPPPAVELPLRPAPVRAEPLQQDPMDRETRKELLELIRENVEYEDIPMMYPGRDMNLIDNLIEMAVSLAATTRTTVRINGEDLPAADVKERMLRLGMEHLIYVLDCVGQAKNIRNIQAYCRTALYNAPETMESYYDNRIRQDRT